MPQGVGEGEGRDDAPEPTHWVGDPGSREQVVNPREVSPGSLLETSHRSYLNRELGTRDQVHPRPPGTPLPRTLGPGDFRRKGGILPRTGASTAGPLPSVVGTTVGTNRDDPHWPSGTRTQGVAGSSEEGGGDTPRLRDRSLRRSFCHPETAAGDPIPGRDARRGVVGGQGVPRERAPGRA